MERFPEKTLARILNSSTDGIADGFRMRQVIRRVLYAVQKDAAACKRYAEACETGEVVSIDGAAFWREQEAVANKRADSLRTVLTSW